MLGTKSLGHRDGEVCATLHCTVIGSDGAVAASHFGNHWNQQHWSPHTSNNEALINAAARLLFFVSVTILQYHYDSFKPSICRVAISGRNYLSRLRKGEGMRNASPTYRYEKQLIITHCCFTVTEHFCDPSPGGSSDNSP